MKPHLKRRFITFAFFVGHFKGMNPNQSARYLTKLMSDKADLRNSTRYQSSGASASVGGEKETSETKKTNETKLEATEVTVKGKAKEQTIVAHAEDSIDDDDHNLKINDHAHSSSHEAACDICGRICKSKAGLSRHKTTH